MKITENLTVKIIAVFIVFFTAIGAVVGVLGSVVANELNVYADGDIGYYQSSAFRRRISRDAELIAYSYCEQREAFAANIKNGGAEWSAENSNIAFTIFDKDGEELLSNRELLSFAYEARFYCAYERGDGYSSVYDLSWEEFEEWKAENRAAELFSLRLRMPETMTVSDGYYIESNVFQLMNRYKYPLIWVALLSSLTLVVAVVFLCCAAGHRAGHEGIVLNPLDRIPYDICIVAAAAILAFCAVPFMSISATDMGNIYVMILYALLCGGIAVTLLSVILTTATRFKVGGWWRNTVIYKGVRFLWRAVLALGRGMVKAASAMAIQWKVMLITLFYSVALMYASVMIALSGGEAVIAIMMIVAAGVAASCLWANTLRRVTKGSREIAGGNIDYKIDTSGMVGDVRNLASDLNSIADGLGIALEQRVKSERLKTELITNVSHDIKTPLTSMINYVDLLRKEPLEGKAVEYAAIIQKHSDRLKKLTVDLIEASKAATGNITAKLVPVNLCELVNQAVGEYEGRLKESGISPVVSIPTEPRFIIADSALIWRVLDNLLSNASKYSLPGTRLYIDVTDRGEELVLGLKNISRERLNIDPSELTERFVRGDSARRSEGSGLGLNIANSLVELQKGKLSIGIDGDMFKAEVIFKRIYPDPEGYGSE